MKFCRCHHHHHAIQLLLWASLLLLSSCTLAVRADHVREPDHAHLHLIADLKCLNNGVARFITRDANNLQARMQAGHMVQECICPVGYRGTSCEVVEEQYAPKCPSSQDCDCAVADSISAFARQQCRKPFTEYCASFANSVGGHISFCTHGGKCKGDLVAAKISPGNTTQNYVFQ